MRTFFSVLFLCLTVIICGCAGTDGTKLGEFSVGAKSAKDIVSAGYTEIDEHIAICLTPKEVTDSFKDDPGEYVWLAFIKNGDEFNCEMIDCFYTNVDENISIEFSKQKEASVSMTKEGSDYYVEFSVTDSKGNNVINGNFKGKFIKMN